MSDKSLSENFATPDLPIRRTLASRPAEYIVSFSAVASRELLQRFRCPKIGIARFDFQRIASSVLYALLIFVH